MSTEIPAYSQATQTEYANWGELIKAESNGWLVVALITSTRTDHLRSWPWIVGPFESKADAERYRAKTRRKWKREAEMYPHLSYVFHVRPAWKPELH